MTVNCPAEFADPFRCPTKEEYLEQLLALLPRGRAWQSHDASTSAQLERYTDGVAECGEAECGEAQCDQPALIITRTVMSAYWAAFAQVNEFFAQRACKLLNEFFCQSVDETLDWWGVDYGFPDPCDPWDDLCEKVAAQGGANCAYLSWAAAQRGWTIDCRDCNTSQPVAMAGCAEAGCSYPCEDCDPNTIHITIYIDESPSFTWRESPPYAGVAFAGCTTLCDPDITQLECLIERVKPAHVQAVYHYERSSLDTVGDTIDTADTVDTVGTA